MDGKETQGLEVTWRRALAVLWSLLWRLAVLGGVLAAVVSTILGLLFAFVLGPSIASVVAGATFTAMMLATAVPITRSVLTSRFADFSIRLVSNDEKPPP